MAAERQRLRSWRLQLPRVNCGVFVIPFPSLETRSDEEAHTFTHRRIPQTRSTGLSLPSWNPATLSDSTKTATTYLDATGQ